MQAPARYDFTIYQGAAFDRTFTWEIGTPSTPVSLVGYIGRMQVRSSVESPIVAVELTTSNGRITLGGAAGTVTIALTGTETADLAPGMYVYDCELVSPGGQPNRFLEGRITVSGEVTR